MIPADARATLAPFFAGRAGMPWESVQLFLRSAPEAPGPGGMARPRSCWTPSVRIRRSPVMLVTGRTPASVASAVPASLRIVGLSEPGVITLDPQFAEDLSTAAGLSLLAHEMEHQEQFATIPDFERRYDQVEAMTPRDRPWENIFELPAYQREREVYCGLVAIGYPEGAWVPMGVQLWGCGA